MEARLKPHGRTRRTRWARSLPYWGIAALLAALGWHSYTTRDGEQPRTDDWRATEQGEAAPRLAGRPAPERTRPDRMDGPPVRGPASHRGESRIEDGRAAAPARGHRRPRLRIIDGATGAPLPTARAYAQCRPRSGFVAHLLARYPDAATLARAPARADQDGLVEANPDDDCWWIVADGYAWQPVARTSATGEDPIVVALDRRGGTLELEVIGWSPAEGLHLFALSGDRADRLPDPSSGGILRVEGLLPGLYQIVVKEGRYSWIYDGRDQIYAEHEVRIVAGEFTRRRLELTPPDRERTRARVVVETISPLNCDMASIVWSGVDPWNEDVHREVALQPAPSGPIAATKVVELPIGRYRLVLLLPNMHWSRRVELTGRFAEQRVDISGSARVDVRVTAPVPGPWDGEVELHWQTTDRSSGIWYGYSPVTSESGRVSLRVPEGALTLQLYSDSDKYLEERRSVGWIDSGASLDVDFGLALGGSIDLLIHKRGKTLDRRVVWAGAVPLEGQPEVGTLETVTSAGPVTLSCLVPGKYLVRVTVDGYDTVEFDGIVVLPGQTKVVHVELAE